MRRIGVTLIELLVAIGIIGLLLAILLPAVQSAREAARRTQCQNHMRQVGSAIHQHHNTHRVLPSLYNGTSLRYPLSEWDLFHTHTWRVPLLPFVEQQAVFDKVVLKELATEPPNWDVLQSVIPAYVCPGGSDPSSTMGWGLRHKRLSAQMPYPKEDMYPTVRSDYDAIAGIVVLPDPPPEVGTSLRFVHWGIWGRPIFDLDTYTGSQLKAFRPGRFGKISDGLSKTIAVVERGGKPVALTNGKPDDSYSTIQEDYQYPGQVGWSASNSFAWSLNADRTLVGMSNSLGIYSTHGEGANVTMADGTVRFLTNDTEWEVLVELFGPTDH